MIEFRSCILRGLRGGPTRDAPGPAVIIVPVSDILKLQRDVECVSGV